MTEPIFTERLILRKATLNDALFILELLNSSSWIKFIGDRDIHCVEDAEDYILKNLIESYQKLGFGLFVVTLKHEQTPIGLCGLLQREVLPTPDIGFALLPAFENKGYTTEAALAVMLFAKNTLKLDKIFALTSPENLTCQKILNKLGLVLQKNYKFKDTLSDLLTYSN